MAVFHVIIDDVPSADKVIQRIKKHYKDYYVYHEQSRLVLVRTDEISKQIAERIGIKGDDKIPDASGAVFKMNANFDGFTNGAVWEWLGKKNGA